MLKKDIINIIDTLLEKKYSDSLEKNFLTSTLKSKLPFHKEVLEIIDWNEKKLNAEEIYEKAESIYRLESFGFHRDIFL